MTSIQKKSQDNKAIYSHNLELNNVSRRFLTVNGEREEGGMVMGWRKGGEVTAFGVCILYTSRHFIIPKKNGKI